MKEQLELWDAEGSIDIGDALLEKLEQGQRQDERALRITLLVKRVNDMLKKGIDEGSDPDFHEGVRELKEAIRIWQEAPGQIP